MWADGRITHRYTHVESLLARWRCKGKFGPVGVTSVGASVCVCNIMLSRRGVAGSNRSTPKSSPCWVISHSPGKSPYTHTHGEAGHIWPVFNRTPILMQRRRQRETSQRLTSPDSCSLQGQMLKCVRVAFDWQRVHGGSA